MTVKSRAFSFIWNNCTDEEIIYLKTIQACEYLIFCKNPEDNILTGFIRFQNPKYSDAVLRNIFKNKATLKQEKYTDNCHRDQIIKNDSFYEYGKPARQGNFTKSEDKNIINGLLQQNKRQTKLICQQNNQINAILTNQSDHISALITKTETVDNNEQLKEIMNICMALAKTNACFTESLTLINNTTTTNNNNNNVKQSFNLNFFLNEQCKDAVNITDFIKSIHLKMEDLVLHRKLGYVDAISELFNKEINKLSLTSRPMHCTDIKRETLYVRNENQWHNDENKKLTDQAIETLSSRNWRQIAQWKEANPDYLTNHNKNQEYILLTKNLMGGSTDYERDINFKKIVKNIVKTTHINKQDVSALTRK